ncbi:DnaD domain protein [Paenibacillus larvae]|uniref:Replication initiation and membrane attachment n=1 Tax=Paenibacillus larvae subsp. larvae TaxID=147375 RepID=A0A6C0QRH4_9BACL|nr:DnaD domain protein [Paenibacillus larvae]QHZ51292.1 Replication initiation and membrane attachment [Paenibacillus larvae subsp. larvae]
MAWIESHQELARHPKTKRFARLLGVSLPAAVGHLHFFWWWAMDYAQDGSLSKYEAEDIADACEWDGDSETLMKALHHAGFVDSDMTIHDWSEYAGRLIEKREQNKERKRKSRAKKNEEQETQDTDHEDVTRPSHGQTEPSREQVNDDSVSHRATEPNLTIPNLKHSGGGVNKERDEPFGKAYESVEKYFGVAVNPVQLSKLENLVKMGIEPEVVEQAAVLTREVGKDIRYFWGILENCSQRGILTYAAFAEDQARRREGQHAKSKGSPGGVRPEKNKAASGGAESEFAYLAKAGRS